MRFSNRKNAGTIQDGPGEGGRCIMNAKRLVFLLAFSAAAGGFAGCGSNGGDRVGAPDGPATFSLSGTVRSGGTGLAGVQVFLSGDVSRTAQTDGQGNFSFAGVSKMSPKTPVE
jgi:hypothetical protein